MRKKLIEINKASACVLYLETGKTVTPVSFVPNEDLASGRAMSVLAPWSGTNTPAYIALN